MLNTYLGLQKPTLIFIFSKQTKKLDSTLKKKPYLAPNRSEISTSRARSPHTVDEHHTYIGRTKAKRRKQLRRIVKQAGDREGILDACSVII